MKNTIKLFGIGLFLAMAVSCAKNEPSNPDNPQPLPNDKGFVKYPSDRVSNAGSLEELNRSTQDPDLILGNYVEQAATKGLDSRLDYNINSAYTFRFIAHVKNIELNGYQLQATHVKIIDNGTSRPRYAIVTYNTRLSPYRGAIELLELSNLDEPAVSDPATPKATSVWLRTFENADINNVDYRDGYIYIVGAGNLSDWYTGSDYRYSSSTPAFLAVIKTGTNIANPATISVEKVIKLPSFAGTNVKTTASSIIAASGDRNGALVILNRLTYEEIRRISINDIRSLELNTKGLYVLNGTMSDEQQASVRFINPTTGNVINTLNLQAQQQREAKSELSVTEKHMMVALNEGGTQIFKLTADGNFPATPIQTVPRPAIPSGASNPQDYVTNGVSNAEVGNNSFITMANGAGGVTVGILGGSAFRDIGTLQPDKQNTPKQSINFVVMKGNVMFVASGLGGLKILVVGEDNGVPVPIGNVLFCNSLNTTLPSFLPEGVNAFAKFLQSQLFEAPITAMNVNVATQTNLYVTFFDEGASLLNTLVYYTYTGSAPVKADVMSQIVNPDGEINLNRVIYKNISKMNAGGGLVRGHLTQIGKTPFPAGTKIGFALVVDAWRGGKVRNTGNFRFTHPALNNYNIANANNNPLTGQAFINGGWLAHLMYKDAGCNNFVVAFEDIALPFGDKDFNDIVFVVSDRQPADGSMLQASTSFDTSNLKTL